MILWPEPRNKFCRSTCVVAQLEDQFLWCEYFADRIRGLSEEDDDVFIEPNNQNKVKDDCGHNNLRQPWFIMNVLYCNMWPVSSCAKVFYNFDSWVHRTCFCGFSSCSPVLCTYKDPIYIHICHFQHCRKRDTTTVRDIIDRGKLHESVGILKNFNVCFVSSSWPGYGQSSDWSCDPPLPPMAFHCTTCFCVERLYTAWRLLTLLLTLRHVACAAVELCARRLPQNSPHCLNQESQ